MERKPIMESLVRYERQGSVARLTMPRAAIEICRQRLSPAHFNRATVLAEVFSPDDAVDAGFLDRVVDGAEIDDVMATAAAELTKLDLASHAATKSRARKSALEAIHEAIHLDSSAYAAARAG